MPASLRLVLAAAAAASLTFAAGACGKVKPVEGPDAHVDALLDLPDAPPAKGKCDAPVALEDFANCIDLIYCDKLSQCGLGSIGDTACENLPVELLSNINGPAFAAAVQGSIDAGRGNYDPDAAGACLTMLQGLQCRDLFGDNTPLATCGFVTGTVAPTQPCALEFECANGSACVDRNNNYYNSQCGSDVCKPRVSAGSPCVTAPCQVGDHCIFKQDTGGNRTDTCAPGDVGAQCNYDYDCDSGYYCNYPAGGPRTDGAGKCAGGLPDGASCDRDQMCGGQLLCVGDQLPTPAGVCRSVSNAGDQCDGQCFGGNLCSVSNGSTTGTCMGAPQEGDPCPTSGFCGLFMMCDDKGTPDPSDDTCQTPGDLGATCTSGGCNLGLVCTADVSGQPTGTCVNLLPDNTACNNSDQCASGFCDSTGTCSTYPTCTP